MSVPSRFTASTPEQARLLLQRPYQWVLGAVMDGRGSAAAVAAETGVSLTRTHHRLTRLLAAGLIEIAQVRARAGRGVKEYRAVAAEYRVPLALTDASDLEELLNEAAAPFFRTYVTGVARAMGRTGGDEDVRLSRDAHGKLTVQYGGGRISADSFGTMGEMRLRPETLTELHARLRELQQWVSQRTSAEQDDPGARQALLGLLLAPGDSPER
ncbi:hypothetical protein [Deinococcus actinosclerus]|uniref:Transcriptional regulator n=1 Tax=Deinococcus actinosclerus TaxID=1768108 RepID=A0ABM5X3M2_9DEIO|nr:hypothetical protein [Deinococcus actinosclerus]ALW88268.1 hypothetical protein AUC44_04655 [Deinococcus actinosclerus]